VRVDLPHRVIDSCDGGVKARWDAVCLKVAGGSQKGERVGVDVNVFGRITIGVIGRDGGAGVEDAVVVVVGVVVVFVVLMRGGEWLEQGLDVRQVDEDATFRRVVVREGFSAINATAFDVINESLVACFVKHGIVLQVCHWTTNVLLGTVKYPFLVVSPYGVDVNWGPLDDFVASRKSRGRKMRGENRNEGEGNGNVLYGSCNGKGEESQL
jgi:hypothetical protein